MSPRCRSEKYETCKFYRIYTFIFKQALIMEAVRGITISISLVTDTKQTSQYSRAITFIRFYVSHHQTCQNMRPTVFLALCTDSKLGVMPDTLVVVYADAFGADSREILQVIVPPKVIIVEHKINPQQPSTKHALPRSRHGNDAAFDSRLLPMVQTVLISYPAMCKKFSDCVQRKKKKKVHGRYVKMW